jgi:hypothetical protein
MRAVEILKDGKTVNFVNKFLYNTKDAAKVPLDDVHNFAVDVTVGKTELVIGHDLQKMIMEHLDWVKT